MAALSSAAGVGGSRVVPSRDGHTVVRSDGWHLWMLLRCVLLALLRVLRLRDLLLTDGIACRLVISIMYRNGRGRGGGGFIRHNEVQIHVAHSREMQRSNQMESAGWG